MLRIRLSRTGRKNYPSYRIVVAEHSRPVKAKFIEILGHYIPTRDPKVLEFDEKKIREWISKGAKPTDTVAALLKNAGVTGMEQYMEPRDKKKKKKKEEEEAAEGGEAPAAPAAEEPKEEAPAEEKADEPKAEEAPKDDAPAEEPKEEEKPEEEPKAEEPAPEADKKDEDTNNEE